MNKILLALLFVLPLTSTAQEKPYQFPKGAASWTVNCEDKEDPDKPKPSPASVPSMPAPLNGADQPEPVEAKLRRIEVSQVRYARRTVINWQNGQSREVWSLPRLGVYMSEDPNGKTFVTKNAAMFGDPFSPDNFTWISSKTQVDSAPVKYDGIECYHYRGFITEVNIHDKTAPIRIPCEVWIDAETRLPVAFQRGKVLGKFTYGPPPEKLELPPRFSARLDYYKITMGIKRQDMDLNGP